MKLIDVTVTRTIPAPAQQVFDVWMDPKSPGGPWFGAAKLIINAVVDGLFYSAVNHEGRVWPHYGRFLVIDRPARVEYTWVSEATQGIESVVSISFVAQAAGTEKGEQTEVTLRHSGLPDDEMGRRHEQGWTFVLSMLARRFESRPQTAAP